MGNSIYSSKKVIPINNRNSIIQNKYTLKEADVLVYDNKTYILKTAYDKLCAYNKKLLTKIEGIENSNFECCICYSKDKNDKLKTRCGHDICVHCFFIIVDKKCPVCRKKLKII